MLKLRRRRLQVLSSKTGIVENVADQFRRDRVNLDFDISIVLAFYTCNFWCEMTPLTQASAVRFLISLFVVKL